MSPVFDYLFYSVHEENVPLFVVSNEITGVQPTYIDILIELVL